MIRILFLVAFFVTPLAWQNAHAVDRAGFYSVKFCNKTSREIYIAYVHRVNPDDDARTLKAWRAIKSSDCSVLFEGDFGRYSNAIFYYYAENNNNGYWSGDGALKLCVGSQKTSRYLSDNYKCRRDERLLTFGKRTINPNKPNFTMNLK